MLSPFPRVILSYSTCINISCVVIALPSKDFAFFICLLRGKQTKLIASAHLPVPIKKEKGIDPSGWSSLSQSKSPSHRHRHRHRLVWKLTRHSPRVGKKNTFRVETDEARNTFVRLSLSQVLSRGNFVKGRFQVMEPCPTYFVSAIIDGT